MQKTSEIVYPTVYNRFDRPKGKGIACKEGEGRTQQQFKEECDVNNIVEMYGKTGLWSHSTKPPTAMPMFGDFTSAPDFLEAQNRFVEANQLFAELPASLRKRFNNNPADYLEFVSKPENTEEAIRLGIATKKPDSSPAEPPKSEPKV